MQRGRNFECCGGGGVHCEGWENCGSRRDAPYPASNHQVLSYSECGAVMLSRHTPNAAIRVVVKHAYWLSFLHCKLISTTNDQRCFRSQLPVLIKRRAINCAICEGWLQVGGVWDRLSTKKEQMRDGLNKLLAIMPYDIITLSTWNRLIPHWMQSICELIGDDDLSEFKILLRWGPFCSPRCLLPLFLSNWDEKIEVIRLIATWYSQFTSSSPSALGLSSEPVSRGSIRSNEVTKRLNVHTYFHAKSWRIGLQCI